MELSKSKEKIQAKIEEQNEIKEQAKVRRRAFGSFVEALRKRKRYEIDVKIKYDDGTEETKKDIRQWSQKKLAEEVFGDNSSEQIIGRIEKGHVKFLEPHLKPLADAFSLDRTTREAFYALAGYIYLDDEEINTVEIKELLTLIPYPAWARTSLWDLIGFNKYHSFLWSYNDKIAKMQEDPVGPNILRLIIDEAFNNKQAVGGPDIWHDKIEQALQAFYIESFRYVNTERYRQIIRGMEQYRIFQVYWNQIAPNPEYSNKNTYKPFASVFNKKYSKKGPLNFLSLRTPSKYLGNKVDISIYIPLFDSQKGYQLLFEEVGEDTEPVMFDVKPLI